jgi:hypothetical protein
MGGIAKRSHQGILFFLKLLLKFYNGQLMKPLLNGLMKKMKGLEYHAVFSEQKGPRCR